MELPAELSPMKYCENPQCWQRTDYDFCIMCRDMLLDVRIGCTSCDGTGIKDYGDGCLTHCSNCLENEFHLALYGTLHLNGLPRKHTLLQKGDVVIGKTRRLKKNNNSSSQKDLSQVYKDDEDMCAIADICMPKQLAGDVRHINEPQSESLGNIIKSYVSDPLGNIDEAFNNPELFEDSFD